MPTDAPYPLAGATPLAAAVLRTARAVLGITTAELATAAGCDQSLVRRIESGEFDPDMDTLGRLVNAVGLELRCGTRSSPNSDYALVDADEVARLAAEVATARDFRGRFGLGPPGPLPGTQADWDGIPPAPSHLFGAGPGRRDEGGWAAILLASVRWELGMTPVEFAAAAGVSETDVARIETGEVRPPLGEVQRILNAAGTALHLRLEVYDEHDDGLHLRALADPDRFDRTIRGAREVFAAAVVVS